MGGTLNGDRQHQSYPQRWMAAGAVISLMESAGMLATVAVGLSMYDCSLNTSSDILWEMTRLYYFSRAKCSPYKVNNNDYFIDGVNKAANRTVIFMSLYTVLYSFWFIASILLLVSAIKGKKMKPNLGRNLQYIWVIPTGCIIILDVIATILFSVDLMSTKDFESVMGLLNIKFDGSTVELESHLSEPPKIMALLASKAGLLWLINVVFLIILLVQFKKMFHLRKQEQFVEAHLSTMPAYLWPPKLAEKNLSLSKDAITPKPAPTIPRLINQDGIGIVAAPQHSGSMGGPRRPSALQIAARQGFSYERPNSGGWSPTNPPSLSRNPQMSAPQGGAPQENPEHWYSRNARMPPAENERPSNILQRDNDVFY
ncbi:AAEL012975-PA [Gryllus bimaculatus]|nr:AAEL012975-PA [Gryllus bimaculatus]